jgi:hypothetical protein
MPHAQPLPLAEPAAKPLGRGSLTVTVPLVAALPPFVTESVKLPEPPREKLELLGVLEIVRFGAPPMFTVTEPVPGAAAPPPLTLAEFVIVAAALAATLTEMVIAG